MSDAGQVADRDRTAGPARSRASPPRPLPAPEMSLSLWRVTGDQAERLAAARTRAAAARRRPGVLLHRPGADRAARRRRHPAGPRAAAGLRADAAGRARRPGRVRRGAAEPPGLGRGRATRSAAWTSRSTWARTPDADQLIQTTAPIPIRGDTATMQVPVRRRDVHASSPRPAPGLTGPLSAALPWIVLGGRRCAGARRRRDGRRACPGAGPSPSGWPPTTSGSTGSSAASPARCSTRCCPRCRTWTGWRSRPATSPASTSWRSAATGTTSSPARRDAAVFVVGDVSGQGLPAATTMAALRFAVRAYLAQGDDIATVLTRLRGAARHHVDHQFATVLLGELDPATGPGPGRLGRALRPAAASAAAAPSCWTARSRPPVGVAAAAPPAVAEVRVVRPGDAAGVHRRRGGTARGGHRHRAGAAALDGGRGGRAAAAGGPRPADAMPTVQGGRDDTVILGLRWPA